jgi:molybdate transport system ATP-binding protein
MIEIDVQKQLGDFRLNARFNTSAGGVIALFGRSGSGKTTLVNLISGLAAPDSGIIKIAGETLFDSARSINIPPDKRQLGYVFQEDRLFPHMSVSGNLRYGTPRGGSHLAFDRIVELLGISHILERRPATLSGGEKQRVAIGRALLANPRLLLMDEPLASLDSARKDEILPFIEQLATELDFPIIYVSHAMDEIVRLADTLVLLSEGEIAAVGSVEEITSRLDLRPLTGRYEAGSVISAIVDGHDQVDGLTRLSFTGGILRVPRIEMAVGRELRIRIRARDVSVALNKPKNISINNVFPGIIKEIGEDQGSQIDILIDTGMPIWARVSRYSKKRLNLDVGTPVHVMIKAVAIDRHSLGLSRRSHES